MQVVSTKNGPNYRNCRNKQKWEDNIPRLERTLTGNQNFKSCSTRKRKRNKQIGPAIKDK